VFVPSPLPRTRAAALRDLASEKEATRVAALRELVPHLLGEPPSSTLDAEIDAVVRTLRDPSAIVRVEAATALADLAVLPAARAAMPALLRAQDDEHPHVAQFALVAAVALATAAGPPLQDDPLLDRARDAVLRALADERPELRYQATIGWTALEGNDALWLARHRARFSDEDPEVRYVAVRIFEERLRGTLAASSAGEVLVPLLDDGSEAVALAAAITLGGVGDRRAVPILTNVIVNRHIRNEKPAPEDEAEAVELAGPLGLTACIPALQRRAFGILRHVRDTCTLQARTALAHLGDARACASIEADLGEEPRKALAAAISAARAGLLPLRARVDAVVARLGDEKAIAEVAELWAKAQKGRQP
jgi:HEAT repeat protein